MDQAQAQVEYIKEKTKLFTEVIKIVTAVFITISAGIITMILDGIGNSALKMMFIVIGAFIDGILLIGIIILFYVTFSLINKLSR